MICFQGYNNLVQALRVAEVVVLAFFSLFIFKPSMNLLVNGRFLHSLRSHNISEHADSNFNFFQGAF